MKKDCYLIILACNTASAYALRKIQQQYLPGKYPNRRLLGVIRPAVEEASRTRSSSIGVIGTYATVNSKSFVKELAKMSPETRVYQKACPLLVPIIEEGELRWKGLNLVDINS